MNEPQERRKRHAATIIGRVALACGLLAGVLVALVWSGRVPVPDRYNPYAPIRVEDEITWLTRHKLQRLTGNRDQCLASLAASPLRYRPLDNVSRGDGCGLTDAVEVQGAGIAFSSRFTATCSVAAGLALLEYHVIQPAAQEHLRSRVTSLDHAGSYACRNVNHRARGRRSEHATANALDLTGFTLANGRRVNVLGSWGGRRADEAAFLRAVRDGACRLFPVVLGPDYNALHRDHFHLDMGRFRRCS
jgi:hypothetical protein